MIEIKQQYYTIEDRYFGAINFNWKWLFGRVFGFETDWFRGGAATDEVFTLSGLPPTIFRCGNSQRDSRCRRSHPEIGRWNMTSSTAIIAGHCEWNRSHEWPNKKLSSCHPAITLCESMGNCSFTAHHMAWTCGECISPETDAVSPVASCQSPTTHPGTQALRHPITQATHFLRPATCNLQPHRVAEETLKTSINRLGIVASSDVAVWGYCCCAGSVVN